VRGLDLRSHVGAEQGGGMGRWGLRLAFTCIAAMPYYGDRSNKAGGSEELDRAQHAAQNALPALPGAWKMAFTLVSPDP
jgi:hypothetical protein